MSDFFDDFSNNLKKEYIPFLIKYFRDPNNKLSDSIDNLLNNPQNFLTEFFENFSTNKYNKASKYKNTENITDIDISNENQFDELYLRLSKIEENMIQIEKILKDKN